MMCLRIPEFVNLVSIFKSLINNRLNEQITQCLCYIYIAISVIKLSALVR